MGYIRLSAAVLLAAGAASVSLHATPQFARRFQRDCGTCHLAPPILNARGEAFVANGYRLTGLADPVPSHRTVPVSVWNTLDYERRYSSTTNRGFLGRVELISAGAIGRSGAAYFAEWRAVSQQIASGNTLLNRSGRFEDLFVTTPLGRTGLSFTAGQFRGVSQVDVSRRLSIAEPLVFSGALPGVPGGSARQTSLRAFSPSGRQPAVRLMWQRQAPDRPADGWFVGGSVLFPGELTIPLVDGASFEFENQPKGVLFESFRRSGIGSVGGHVFVGNNSRLLVMGVVAVPWGTRLIVTGAAGWETTNGVEDYRLSAQIEAFLHRAISVAGRVEDRSGSGRLTTGVVTLNAHVPFGPAAFRQAFRLQIEQRIQKGDHRTLAALSHVF